MAKFKIIRTNDSIGISSDNEITCDGYITLPTANEGNQNKVCPELLFYNGELPEAPEDPQPIEVARFFMSANGSGVVGVQKLS